MTVFFEKQIAPAQSKKHRQLDEAYINMRASLIGVITDSDKTNLEVIKPITRIAVSTKNIYENIISSSQKHSYPSKLEDYCELYQQALADLPSFKKNLL